MDTLNITIGGHLGIPGFSRTRVPPPFGTPRHIIQAIESRKANALSDEVLGALAAGNQALRGQWRPRLKVIAIGVVCTVMAALTGWHTGQRRQPLPHIDRAPVVAATQPTAPAASTVHAREEGTMPSRVNGGAVTPAPTEAIPMPATVSETASASIPAVRPDAAAAAASPPALEREAPARLAEPAKPRMLARAVERSVPHAMAPQATRSTPAMSMGKENEAAVYAPTEDVPVISAYVAPGAPASTIQLQRHTRLID